MATKAIAIGILIFILIVIIIYTIVMFESFKKKSFVFAPYIPPTPPTNHFFPLGEVTPMTPSEIEQRNAIICSSYAATQGKPLPGCPTS